MFQVLLATLHESLYLIINTLYCNYFISGKQGSDELRNMSKVTGLGGGRPRIHPRCFKLESLCFFHFTVPSVLENPPEAFTE